MTLFSCDSMSVEEGSRGKQIELAIRNVLDVSYCAVNNTSENHKGHSAYSGESHFEIIVVSPGFTGLAKIARHRMIFDMLKEQFELGLHSLSMKLWTEDEYKNQ